MSYRNRLGPRESSDANWPMVGLVVGLIVVITVAIIFIVKGHNEWQSWCVSQGGHVVDQTSTGTIVTVTNGKVGTGVSSQTTYYCISATGTIIDIE